ncbi:Sec-dependent nitrous-oxide reductase [Lentimicrobium sp.]
MTFAFVQDGMSQKTLADVKKSRGLTDDDVLSAVKTFMPRGGRDEYFGFMGTGNSGTMVVYGLPSMRIYKYVGVFSPEPWQGYGFDDESTLMLKKGSLDNTLLKYGDMRFPALSETEGKYNGKYLFYSDGANSRIAVLGLDDFETKQVLMHPLFINAYPGVSVSQNTEYVFQTSEYPTPWDHREADAGTEYESKFKAGITAWEFEDTDVAAGSGHHVGRLIKENSFTLELPALTLGYFDAGRSSSHGLLVGVASFKDNYYLYVYDYQKAKGLKSKSVNDFAVIPLNEGVNAGVIALIPLTEVAKSVKVDPSGKYFITASNTAMVFDFDKVKKALDNKTYAGGNVMGIPQIDAASVLHGKLSLGNNVIDLAFDYRPNVVYASVYADKKVVRWNYETLKVEQSLTLNFKPGHLMTPQGNSAQPHSNYLTVVDKEGNNPNMVNIGPTRPGHQHLIDISSDKMRDIYTMTIPQANIYGSVSVLRTTIKPIIRYALGTNTRTGEISRFKTVAGQEKIERKDNRVHIFGTLIRSHITPEIVEVEEGDIVTFHLTNLERAEDETHGFTVSTYGVHGSFEPGKTASLTFVADRPGAFPYYCTEFCSALHLEMEGILMVRPKGYVASPEDMQTQQLTPAELAAYKKNYEEKIKVINETNEVINGVVTYLKENNYQKYPYVEALVADALDQMELAKSAKTKYENYAAEGKWRDAFLWAEQYWQYQVKTADVGLRAKKLLDEQLSK